MSYIIVSDSSSNLYHLPGAEYKTVPLKIITAAAEYVDDEKLDVEQMVNEIKVTKGRSGTSCPNVNEWIEAFGTADMVFAVTITSRLSGSCSAAEEAARIYEETHAGAKVFVVDSLSTGPEMQLIIEHLKEHIDNGESFEEIKNSAKEYMQRTHLLFSLQSLTNLARNGRVNPAVAKIAGVLGIRVLGAAKEGVLDPLHKIRGESKTIDAMYEEMKKRGFCGGKVRIDHCFNTESAEILKEKILSDFPQSDVKIGRNGALCSFYAERGGVLVGFETK